jgi:hypothetical protein
MAFHFSMSIHKAGFPPTLATGLFLTGLAGKNCTNAGLEERADRGITLPYRAGAGELFDRYPASNYDI